MTNKNKNGVEFDPGFAPHVLAFNGALEYVYSDINRFKNLSQKKLRFQQYYKKILDVFYNNIGFYTGCLMWAAYINTQEKQPILNNPCFGQKYDEKANIAETEYIINFAEIFHKDIKYYLSKDFSFDENIMKLLNTYKDFLIINKGFTETEFNTDIKLPKNVKTDKSENYNSIIKNAIDNGDLSILKDSINEII